MMSSSQNGAPPPRSSNRPARPSSSSCHQTSGNNGGSAHKTSAQLPRTDTPLYKPLCYLGKGSFGVVLLAEDTHSGEKVAIKRVRYDPRLHNREVTILNSVLVDHKASSKLNVAPCSDASRSSSPLTPFAEKNVEEWTGIHHPNIVALMDSYVTYDRAPTEADATAAAAAAAAFHAQMAGVAGHHPDSEFFSQMHQSAAAGPAYAYLEMVMSYLPMDLNALKRHFYRHHLMPTASSSTQLFSSSANAAAAKAEGEAENNEEGRAPQVSASPPRATGRPVSPKVGAHMPLRWVKIFLFQLARALAFMHAHHVCHRDIKPANVLVDPDTGRLQLCDFGSAKEILYPTKEKNVSYICSRYYRAPELLFGALHYGCEVDMWSFGCILAELLRESGRPLFRGCTSVDQMAEIFKVMGAPSKREMYAMNPQCAEALLRTHAMHKPRSMPGAVFGPQRDEVLGEEDGDLHGGSGHAGYDGFMDDDEEDALEGGNAASTARHAPSPSARSAFPHRTDGGDVSDDDTLVRDEMAMPFDEYYNVLKVRAIPWKTLFPVDTPNEAVALATALLCYVPQKRLSALEVVEHAFFDDLFAPAPSSAAEGAAAEAHRTASTGAEEEENASLRMPNGQFVPLEMFQVTETERELFTEAFLAKMARQAKLVAAAMKKEAQG
ncbi:putative protein kinase [Leptomonas pyrrhocoris]|uniref:Protein kinase domain-containing protein n=1 Tax=Leptomonas pyrrhocoris TaxID=157538 RepID=A0A0M9G9W0_LEPPY|nr:putative protein kinase [Leptomonas pyrrhocoris]KPA85646.1 putative protein kinase [Leptomonas pyrrhocoris]|eukprot:XP_015664085.1 putative protein kinase [Leptomonas pyrrhocoris]